MPTRTWLAPTQHEPDWHYVDDEGNLLGKIGLGMLGWNWSAWRNGKIIAGGGAEKSPTRAKRYVENAHKTK